MRQITPRIISIALDSPNGLSSLLPDIITSPTVFDAKELTQALSTMPDATNTSSIISEFTSIFPEDNIALFVSSDITLLTVGENGNIIESHFFDDEEIISMPQNRKEGLNVLDRFLREAHYTLEHTGEKNIIKKDLQKRENIARNQRKDRLKTICAIPDDFDEAIQYLAKWSSCFEEFKALFKNSMFDMSNRNLTRLGRATLLLDAPYTNPEDPNETTIYRALPIGDFIEEGDWITTNEAYAQMHLEKHLNGDGIVLPLNVRADEIYATADEKEQIYIPDNTWGECTSLKQVWNSFNHEDKPDKYPSIQTRTIEEIQNNNKTELSY